MIVNEKTTLLELSEKVKGSSLGDRSSLRHIASLRRILELLRTSIYQKEALYKRAILVGSLLKTTLWLVTSLRLDVLGCINLSEDTNDDQGNRMLPMWKKVP